jgi:hypothetical protein
MLDYRSVVVLAQFSFGASLFWTGVYMVLYQYLLAKGGERLRPDASEKVFYLAIALMFIVFGTYASMTAFFR